MKNKFRYIMIFFIVMNVMAIADSNPLKEYISDKVYFEGQKKFKGGNDIFRTKVYSKADISKELDAARGRIKSVFLKVSFIIERNHKLTATFYYKGEDGRAARKVITNRKTLKIGKYSYSVIVVKNGIEVIDLKTKVKVKIEKKGR
ncbi:hypothetical protein [Haliovirga abyssi]|uniref:Uncharacterized protein n=1 Tax=Haliovirga abyssi TaxID=2996794 RepID=A0AAU9DRL2_9FUSO|nr:hypothetical protein [Haliovirga abyssi]BDU49584.1 hypothetical protein HLVA_01530 [Haliovirga abyssi]